MKRKIGIVTLTGMYNYGNSLQNYAVQRKLIELGFEAETIYFKYSNILKKIISSMIKRTSYYKKILGFLEFERKYIVTSKYKNILVQNDKVDQKYFCFCVGSDQVWNTSWYENYPFMKSVYLLTFTNNKNKISFSSSFGIDNVYAKYKTDFANELAKFKAISVREDVGKKIIKELTGREATVLVDPTMLLTKEEWISISKKPKLAREGFVLTYFLSPKCDAAKNKLDEVAKERNIYELLNPDDEVVATAGPSEFLWLFDHADIVLTDSFHACVFAFLFNKPFVVYDRNWSGDNMNSRIETLLSKFSLQRKYVNSGFENDIWEHDYTLGYVQLEKEREKATKFLKDSLKG